MNAVTPLADLRFPEPSEDVLASDYASMQADLEAGRRETALATWDHARRAYLSWANLARLRFQQDTTDEEAARVRALADRLDPIVQGHDTAMKRRLLADPDRVGLETLVGTHPVRLWQADLGTFSPTIAGRLEEEQRLASRYTATTAAARILFRGETLNLPGLAPSAESLDRAVRHDAARAQWDFFAAQGDRIDGLYAELVRLRHGMARDLGEENFLPVAYRRMRRVGFGPDEIARFRDEIVEHVVPLVGRLMERRRIDNGLDRLMAWDLRLVDPLGNPKPLGTTADLLAASQVMFDRFDPAVGSLHRVMLAGGYFDVETRPNKSPGGQSEPLPLQAIPWVFANFTGTRGDIAVHVHEMGHAFQAHASFGKSCWDAEYPSAETAEIHSMALELLTASDADLLVGPESADRFRRAQLIGFLEALPMLALGDHWQHEIYANPDLSPDDRHAVWREMERRYTPWQEWGDLAHPAKGASWHGVLHYFLLPLYFIDYALASCCALQLWTRARHDRAGAMQAYLQLCRRGGDASFEELLRDANLISPFDAGSLAAIAAEVEQALGM